MQFETGDIHKCWLNGRNYKIHIVAVVDGCMVVYKWYGKHKQWWHYEVKHADDLECYIALAAERPNS